MHVNGFMFSALDFRSSGSGLSPGPEHCILFLGKTIFSLSPLTVAALGEGSRGLPSPFILGKKEEMTRFFIWDD